MEFRLRECREKQGLSIRKLALLSSVSASEISQIENGIIKNPSLKVYTKLGCVLGICVFNDLLRP